MKEVLAIQKEHYFLCALILDIKRTVKRRKVDYIVLKEKLARFYDFWKKHEKREESLLRKFNSLGKPFPTEMAILDEHRQLRGHWHIIQESIDSGDNFSIKLAFDTDGAMFIEKLMKHIELENNFFKTIDS